MPSCHQKYPHQRDKRLHGHVLGARATHPRTLLRQAKFVRQIRFSSCLAIGLYTRRHFQINTLKC